MDLANWLKSLVLTVKYPRGVSSLKNGSLCELRHQRVIAFLFVAMVRHRIVTVRSVVHRKDYRLEVCEGICSGK